MEKAYDIIIRRATSDDIEELRGIGIATFVDSFGDQNTDSNMEWYISRNFSLEQVESQLNNPESEFYLAYLKNDLIGYLKINIGSAQTEQVLFEALEIERIYVASEHQGKKIGRLFLDKAVEVAQEAGIQTIWLGVWDQNVRAISFYERNGFAVFGSHPFQLGDEDQTDILMKIELG